MRNGLTIALTTLAMLCLLGCGVKSRESAQPSTSPVSGGGDLPKNVYHTSEKKFLVYASHQSFKVGATLAIYRVLSPDLKLPVNPKLEFKIKYFMPEMPEMPVVPAVVTEVAPGQIEVNYDISMEGAWEFRLEIYTIENGSKIMTDQFVHRDMVKE